MKTLHPKLLELQKRTAGEYLTCRYVNQSGNQISADYRVRASSDDAYVIEGYLAVFGIRDSYGTVAVKGCFAKSLNDRGPKSQAKDKIIHLWMHDRYEPVGQYEELFEDDYGLRFKLRVDNVPNGRPEQVRIQTKSGTLNQYSYGFEYVWDKMEYVEDRDAILMFEVDLFEGSSISILASCPETYTIRSQEELSTALEDLGFEADQVIRSLPKKVQIELKQLITRYKSLANRSKPVLPLTIDEPNNRLVIGDYKLNLNEFSNQ